MGTGCIAAWTLTGAKTERGSDFDIFRIDKLKSVNIMSSGRIVN